MKLTVSLLILLILGLVGCTSDPKNSSVMITNKDQTHGGTGIVFESRRSGTRILTNDHVCRAIKDGGLVKTETQTYQVESYLESDVSDLCMIYVAANLHRNVDLSEITPKMFDEAEVVGHPGLLPTVVTQGHFSGREIISVIVGFKECTEEDAQDPLKALLCAFLGGLPIQKSYESVLVTATIMPGSSGSGVYNSHGQLSGVVFAGQGDLGYAWIVPYEQVMKFVNVEVHKKKFVNIDQTVPLFGQRVQKRIDVRDALKKCNTTSNPKLEKVCSILKRDVMWTK